MLSPFLPTHSIFRSLKRIAIFTATAALLSGCVSVIDASTDKPIQPDAQKRSFGEYIDDEKLETIVAVNIRKASPALDIESHVNVYAYKSVILLTGETPTELAKNQAGIAAKNTGTVRQVHNELSVGPNSGFKSRTMDNWYKNRVKSRIASDFELDKDRVLVIVENNVVYLMGKVSQQESARITELARTTKGIERVVRVFEYID